MMFRTIAATAVVSMMFTSGALACSWNKQTTAEAKPAQSTIAATDESKPAQTDVATARKQAEHDAAQAAVDTPSEADPAALDVAQSDVAVDQIEKPKS